MDFLIILLVLVWGSRIILNTLTYAELWRVKEYRWDRMIIHLRTAQGRRILWPAFRRPPITPKSTLLVVLSLWLSGYIVWMIPTPILLRLAIADIMSFPMTWMVVLVLNAPTKTYHKVLITLAIRKLRSHTPMTVIGITGSYGKTSVKDYLATILSSTYKTLKTEASRNSPVGIAEVIIKDLKPDDEVFVVEIGAYKPGEIAEMTRMVRPQIGIVTAINPQHQDLFGTIENTMKAKYELIAGLSGKRIAIMNTDDARVYTMAQWAKRDGCDVWDVTTSKIKNEKLNINSKTFVAQDVHSSFKGIYFICVNGKERVTVRADVVGAHQVMNILLAIAGAVAAGMKFDEATRAAGNIRPAPKVLEIVPGVHEATFINDTFNNNPDAARAALDVLAWGKSKKILVFQPMIELGSYARESHEAVGAYAGKICDEIILTNSNFYESFVQGVRESSKSVHVSVVSSEKAAALIRAKTKKGDIVLFKGKEAEHVLRLL